MASDLHLIRHCNLIHEIDTIVLKEMAGRNIVAGHDCFEETRKNCRGLENRTRHRCNSVEEKWRIKPQRKRGTMTRF